MEKDTEKRGGANIIGGIPGETFKIGTVVTRAVENDTVELLTAAEKIDDAPELTARLRLRFDSAQRDGESVKFRGRAEYLRDKGSYTLHSKDFRVLLYKKGFAGAQGSEGEWADQFDFFEARDDGPLVTLDPEKPEQDFSFTVPGVRKLDDSEAPSSEGFGYVEYRTPEELWGHRINPPDDYVPGRLCFQEGKQWHDMPLFPEADFPCG